MNANDPPTRSQEVRQQLQMGNFAHFRHAEIREAEQDTWLAGYRLVTQPAEEHLTLHIGPVINDPAKRFQWTLRRRGNEIGHDLASTELEATRAAARCADDRGLGHLPILRDPEPDPARWAP